MYCLKKLILSQRYYSKIDIKILHVEKKDNEELVKNL